METGPGHLGQRRLVLVTLVMIKEDALLWHVLGLGHLASLIIINIIGGDVNRFCIRDDLSPGRLGSRSAGVQGVGLLVNIIEIMKI